MIDYIGGRIFDAAHDAFLFLWRKVREPTPGKPESEYERRGRQMLSDAAKFRAALEKHERD